MKFFTIYVKSFQSIYDLAVEQYGSVDHIDYLITDNPTLDLENDIPTGTPVKIRSEISVLDEATKKYFSENNENIATWVNESVSPGYTPTDGLCEPVDVVAKNTNGDSIASDTFPAGSDGEIIIQDSSLEVNGDSFDSIPASTTYTMGVFDDLGEEVGTAAVPNMVVGRASVELNGSTLIGIRPEKSKSITIVDATDGDPISLIIPTNTESVAEAIVPDSSVLIKDALGNTLYTISVKAGGTKNQAVSAFHGKKVYYNRPLIQNVTSYHDYDEGWMYVNNYDPAFYPTDGILQRLDPSVSPDYLKYNNAFGHKFRFTGLNGGYYDFNTGQYKLANGTVSTYDAVFVTPVSGTTPDGYAIDHLTGIGWRTIRGGSGGVTWNNMWLNGVSAFGWTDWYIPTNSYALTLSRVDSTTVLQASRPPFNWDQQYGWTNNSQNNATVNAYQYDALSGQLRVVVKTSSGSGNRFFSRLHYARTAYVLQ